MLSDRQRLKQNRAHCKQAALRPQRRFLPFCHDIEMKLSQKAAKSESDEHSSRTILPVMVWDRIEGFAPSLVDRLAKRQTECFYLSVRRSRIR